MSDIGVCRLAPSIPGLFINRWQTLGINHNSEQQRRGHLKENYKKYIIKIRVDLINVIVFKNVLGCKQN